MMGEVTISGKKYEGNGKLEDLIRKWGFHPDSFLYVMEGVPIPADTEIVEDDKVDAIRVASGG